MDNRLQHASNLLYGLDSERRVWYKFFLISLLCHILFFAGLVLFPDFRSGNRRMTPTAINVHMVALKSRKASGGSAVRVAAKPEKAVATHKPAANEGQKVHLPPKKKLPKAAMPKPAHQKPVSLAPKKWKPKTSLKKKTFKPATAVKRAIRELEKNTARTREKTLASALARLKKEVRRQGPAVGLKREAAAGKTFPGATGGQSGLSPRALQQIDIYKAEVAYEIQKHWAFSEQLAGDTPGLEAVLVIKILPNGTISDIWFEKRSGNRYLDESAYKAVQKSNPLPRLPEGYLRPFYNLGLVFTPSGLK